MYPDIHKIRPKKTNKSFEDIYSKRYVIEKLTPQNKQYKQRRFSEDSCGDVILFKSKDEAEDSIKKGLYTGLLQNAEVKFAQVKVSICI